MIVQKLSSDIVPGNFYKPSEFLSIFRNFLSNKEINTTVLCIHGIYWKSDKIYGMVAYDLLRDENSTDEITLVVPLSLRGNLKNGNLVSVYGTIDRKLQPKGFIQILLSVTRIDKIKEVTTPIYNAPKSDVQNFDRPSVTVEYILKGSSAQTFVCNEYEEIIKKEESIITVRSHVKNKFNFYQRILSFGTDCKLLSPQSVQKEFLQIIKDIKAGYSYGD